MSLGTAVSERVTLRGPGQAEGRGCPAWPHGTATCSARLHLGGCRQVGGRACRGRAWPRPSSPHTPLACSEATPQSIWAATWAVHRPSARLGWGSASACTRACRAPTEPSSCSAQRDHLGAAGPPWNRAGQLPECRGPRHKRLRDHSEWTGHRPCEYTAHTHTEDAQGHSHSRVWTHGHVSHSLRLSWAGLGQSLGADRPPCWPLGSAHGGESRLLPPNTERAPPSWEWPEGQRGPPIRTGPGRGLAWPGLRCGGLRPSGKGQGSQQGWEEGAG